jgi:glycosyltransferase involved in cell wall biosynthesis
MIYLMAPPPDARISGGFRVNKALFQRLTATGTGIGIHANSEEVVTKIRSLPLALPTHIVLDSLYLASLNPAHLSHALAGRNHTTRLYFLLHFLPCMDPLLSSTKRKVLQEKERGLLALASKVLAPGPTLAHYLNAQSLYTGAIHYCSPGVELSDFSTIQSDPWDKDPYPRLMTVGTLSRGKGQLEILSHLQHIVPAFKGTWRLFGDLQIEPEIYFRFRNEINNSKLKHSIYLCRSIPHSHISRALAGADLFVSASRFESYGMAIAEAVAAGVPVLAYKAGEMQQWIKEGENGFLIPNGDQEFFLSILKELLNHPEKLSRLKNKAQKIKEEILFPTWEMTFQFFLEACK